MISTGFCMSQSDMVTITILKLQSFHGIGSNILSKGNIIILNSLANSQRINEHKICNPLNTLTHPKANFAVCVYRCCFISNVILIFKNAIVVIFVCYHSLSLLQLGFEMFHMRKCLFSRSQVEITSITIGCKTTLHQFMKFKNINHFFKAIDWKILSSSFQSLHP